MAELGATPSGRGWDVLGAEPCWHLAGGMDGSGDVARGSPHWDVSSGLVLGDHLPLAPGNFPHWVSRPQCW